MAIWEDEELNSGRCKELEMEVEAEALAEYGSELDSGTIGAEAATVGTITLDESGGSGSSPCSAEKRFGVVIFSAGLKGLNPCSLGIGGRS